MIVTGKDSTQFNNENAAIVLSNQTNVVTDGLTSTANKNTGGSYINSTGCTLSNFTITLNGANGFGLVGSKNCTLRDGLVAHNNAGVTNPGWINAKDSSGNPAARTVNGVTYLYAPNEGGGGKIEDCDGLLFQRIHYLESGGVQLWFDSFCTNITLEDLYIEGAFVPGGIASNTNPNGQPDWVAIGLAIENCLGPFTITRGYLKGNRLAIQESQNVTINGMIFDHAGIEFRSGGSHPIRINNITFNGAQFVGPQSIGYSDKSTLQSAPKFANAVADTQSVVDQVNAITPGGCKLVPTSSITIPTTPPGAFSPPPTGGGTVTPPPVILPLSESADGSYVGTLTPAGTIAVKEIVDASGNQYTIKSTGKNDYHVSVDPATANVAGILYSGKRVYQQTKNGQFYDGPTSSAKPCADPRTTDVQAQLAQAQIDLATQTNLVALQKAAMAQLGKLADQMKAISG